MLSCDTCGFETDQKPDDSTCPHCQTGALVPDDGPDPVADTLAALVIEGFIDPDDVPHPLANVVGDETAETVARLANVEEVRQLRDP